MRPDRLKRSRWSKQIVRQVDLEAGTTGVQEQLQFISHPVRREDPEIVKSVAGVLVFPGTHASVCKHAPTVSFALATSDQHRAISSDDRRGGNRIPRALRSSNCAKTARRWQLP